MNPLSDTAALAESLERDLMARYGPLISNDDLRQALGYVSMEAFRQALSRKTAPVPVFSVANRRGKYALTKDVAAWLAAQRMDAVTNPQNRKRKSVA